jgi:Ran GTPase-activating protein 1
MFTGRLKHEIPVALEAFVDVFLPMQLVELDLSDNAFGPAGAKPLMKLLTENRFIQVLKLNNNGLGIEGGRCIAQALVDAQEKNKAESKKSSLRIIQMGRNRLESAGARHLIKAFEAHSESLEQIKMPQNSIRPDVMKELMACLSKCSNLNHLDLQDNTFTDVGSFALAEALPHWPQLSILNVGECLLRSPGSKEIFKVLKENHVHLEKLYLSFNEINQEAAEEIPEMLKNKKNLIALELNGNEFDPQGSVVRDILAQLKMHGHEDALDELDEMEFGESDDEESEEEQSDQEKPSAEDEDEVTKAIHQLKLK